MTTADGVTQVVTITINGANDTPVANNDIVLTNIVDFSPINIPNAALLYNDTDVDGTLTVNGVSNPVNGTIAAGAVFDPTTPPTSTVTTYNFVGVTTSTNDHFAWDFEIDPSGSFPSGTFPNTNILSGLQTGPGLDNLNEASNAEYTSISAVRQQSLDHPGSR